MLLQDLDGFGRQNAFRDIPTLQRPGNQSPSQFGDVVSAISKGLGYASKVVDGASRGRAPATLEAMRALGVLGDRQLTKLAAFGRPVLYNRAGRVVGEIRCRPIVAIEKAR